MTKLKMLLTCQIFNFHHKTYNWQISLPQWLNIEKNYDYIIIFFSGKFTGRFCVHPGDSNIFFSVQLGQVLRIQN